jgi:pilus assembly protein CpaE
VARPAVAVVLPPDERDAVVLELAHAGFDPIAIEGAPQLEDLLARRRDVAVAILDADVDVEEALELQALVHAAGQSIPALVVASIDALDAFVSGGTDPTGNDEYVTRPYSPDSIRWRVEAMCIRSQTVDDGSGSPVQNGPVDVGDWARQATIVAVFSPKGGVGKTTIATHVASALQLVKGQRVLLVDADTVTGHVATSLGLEQGRTLADSWRDELDGGEPETLAEIGGIHPSGMRVVALTANPLNTEILEPDRVVEAITASRRGFDFVVVDMHGSYGALNQAIFNCADRVLVPVTPDVPSIRAAVQLREVAADLGVRHRLEIIVNRANSGVSVPVLERSVGMPALAQLRSAGLLFVRAANEGRTVIEMFPKERISAEFDALADRLVGTAKPAAAVVARSPFRLFGRQKEALRA